MAGLSSPPFPREALEAWCERELDEPSLYLAWELTRCCVGLTPDEERSIVLTVLASIAATQRGHTRLDLAELPEYFRLFGAPEELLELARGILTAVVENGENCRGHEILGTSEVYKPLILEPDSEGLFLYHQRMWSQEQRLGRELATRIFVKPDTTQYQAILDALDDVLEHPAKQGGRLVRLTAEQQHAVRTALGRPLTLISGGPGTGKTAIVVSMLRLLMRLEFNLEDIVLAAPTGKAAHRMGESIRSGLTSIPGRPEVDSELLERLPEAQTIHRLLGYSQGSDRSWYHQRNRMTARLVIVDEASMIDLDLMDRLAGALPDDAKLVLLGDANQLPAIRAGAVFQALSVDGGDAETDPRAKTSIVLSKSHRMDSSDPGGRHLLSIAALVREGNAAALFDRGESQTAIDVRNTPGDLRFEGVELLELESSMRSSFFEHWFDTRVASHPHFSELVGYTYSNDRQGFSNRDAKALDVLFSHLESHKILTVTRRDATEANAAMHDVHAHRFPVQRMARAGGEVFIPGEPVMVLRNDYDRGLFNGDQGVVVNVSVDGEPARPRCVFRRGQSFELFNPESLSPHLVHGFAMTVHKSQGSEFNGVALVLPEEDMLLSTREVLYTALTRSAAHVALVGDRSIVLAAVSRSKTRSSGLTARILSHSNVET